MSDLERKVKDKTAVIGVIGLGYVGLPLALAFSKASFKVIGIDNHQNWLDRVYKRVSCIRVLSYRMGFTTFNRRFIMTSKVIK